MRKTESFSIPVYEWKDNLFTIPISLEYNSSGFRPGAACSPVGHDWALNFGGVITREVRGIPDETWHLGYSASSVFYANPSGSDDPVSNYIFAYPNYRHLPDPYEGYAMRGFANWYNSYSSPYALTTQKYIYTGKLQDEFVCGSVLANDSTILVENEPDVFHFNMPGYSGSFILCSRACVADSRAQHTWRNHPHKHRMGLSGQPHVDHRVGFALQQWQYHGNQTIRLIIDYTR